MGNAEGAPPLFEDRLPKRRMQRRTPRRCRAQSRYKQFVNTTYFCAGSIFSSRCTNSFNTSSSKERIFGIDETSFTV